MTEPTFKLDDRTDEELIDFLLELAGKVKLSGSDMNWKGYLTESMKQRPPDGQQAPDAALLHIAAKLYKKYLQPELNKLPEHLNERYYHRLLKHSYNEAQPDRAFVYFEPNEKVVKQPSLIESGLELCTDRNSNNKNIIFETEQEVQLSSAQIVQAHTLFYSGGGSYQGIFKDQVFNSEGFGRERYEDAKGNEAAFFETFGRSPLYKKKWTEIQGTPESAAFGFVTSSSLLYLEDGERTITLIIPLEGNTATLSEDVQAHLKKCFCITTADGWVPLKEEEVTTIQIENSSLKLEIKLAVSAPQITTFPSFSDTPALRVLVSPFRHENALNQLTILRELAELEVNLNEIELAVNVSSFRAISCRNELGELNLRQAFLPYGATPANGDKLIIGSAEITQKSITSLNLKLDWLADDQTTPNEFSCSINGEEYGDSCFSNAEIITQDLTPPTHEIWQTDLPDYDQRANWGYLELSLKDFAPNNNQNRTYTITETENNGQRTIELPETVVPNYEAKNLELAYEASGKGKDYISFQHCYPLGLSEPQTGKCTLVQDYTFSTEKAFDPKKKRGMLYLGIQELPPGPLNLYFDLMGSSMRPLNANAESAEPNYYVLRADHFEPLAVLTDGTDKLGQSGVISLHLPDCRNDQPSGILPDCCTWLAIVAPDKPEYYGLTNSIHLHATAAVRKLKAYEKEAAEIEILPIKRSEKKEPRIKRVVQPYANIPPVAREQPAAFQRRMQRYLRTQQRYPFREGDLEALIKEEYPQVYRCGFRVEGRSMHITLLPYRKESFLRPAFTLDFLKEVQKIVKEKKWLPSWMKVIVENPHYAEFQLQVKLAKEYSKEEELARQKHIVSMLHPWSQSVSSTKNKVYDNAINQVLYLEIEELFSSAAADSCVLLFRKFKGDILHNNRVELRSEKATGKLETLCRKFVFIPDVELQNHRIFHGEDAEFSQKYSSPNGAINIGRDIGKVIN